MKRTQTSVAVLGLSLLVGVLAVFLATCSQPFRADLYKLVTAKPTPTPPVAVQSIAFSSPNNSPPSLSFQVGTTVSQSVGVAFTPVTATNKNVTWTSMNGKVTIVPTGPNTARVTPVTGAGAPTITDNDTITATPADGGTALQKTCAVVFTGASAIPVTGIALDQTTISVANGASAALKVTISPTGSSVQTVNWTISSTSGATAAFSSVGTTTTTSTDQSTVAIVGGTPGTGVTVTATLVDGSNTFTKTCAVTVTDTPVTGVAFVSPPASISVGSSATVTVRVTPSGASNSAVTWSTNQPTFVTVTPGTHTGDDSSATVAVGAGAPASFTVTATSNQNNAVTATQTFTAGIAVASVTINQSTAALLEGETAGLTAAVLPINATLPTVTWSSSNNAVVSVNATTGQLQAQTGQGGNSATITATADGKTSTPLVVTVVAPAQVPVLGAPASPGGGVYTGATMALDPTTGFPVIAYRDAIGNGHVQQWLGGGTWSTNMSSFNVGAFLIDTTGATNLALAVDSLGNPTVGYIASSNSAVNVTQWNGTFWNSLSGAGGFTSRYLSLAIGPYHSINGPTLTDVPFLSMGFDFVPPQSAALEVYDTTFPTWALSDVGALSYDGPNSTLTSSIFNPNGSPSASSVLVASLINGTNLRVRGFPGEALKAQTTVSGATSVSLGVDGQGLVYVATADTTGTARLYQQSGSSLVQAAIIASQADHLSLVFDPRPGMEVAYVSFRNISTGTASLWKWDSGAFGLLIADVSGTGAPVDGTKLVMSSSGHLYYQYESQGVVTVKDFVR